MTSFETFLENLLTAPGLSGYERPVCELIADRWRAVADEVTVSCLGSLHALRKAAGDGDSPTVMIAAHMDAIGLMVKEINGEFLMITGVGGVDPRILPGQAVTVHGSHEYPGIVQMMPPRFLPESEAGKPPAMTTLFIDTGLTPAEIKKNIRVGSIISFANPPRTLEGGYITGHSLDNRVSVAALDICLEELRNFRLAWNVICAATSGEEENAIGARTSTFEILPDLAIALDVTFAREPGINDYRSFPLGKGLSIGVGANNHPALLRRFKELADELDLPYALEMMPASSGTDAMAMQITSAGIPTLVIGIPIRYMHTPVELTALKDIRRAGRLLARFITSLEVVSLSTLLKEQTA